MTDRARLAAAVASFLLRHPDDEWRETLAALTADRAMAGLGRDRARSVAGFLDWGAATPLADLQETYADTFDLSADTTLNLTAIVFGDEKDRGRRPQRGFGLSQLADAYRAQGFVMRDGELPDCFPALLEFLAVAGCPEGFDRYLKALRPAIRTLRERLSERGSPYAAVVRLGEGAVADAIRARRGASA